MGIHSRVLIISFSVVLFSACATQIVRTDEAALVPADRIVDSRLIQPDAKAGEVIVKRDKGLGGSACSTRIFVNGQPVADIRPGEKLVMHVPEGGHILSATPNGVCGGGMPETMVSVKSGDHHVFRVGYGSNGDFYLNPTAF